MTRKEQEKLGKEIVERLNKGESVDRWNISNFYNIKQFHYIKIEKINSKEFYLIVLPIDNEGNSFLEVRFSVCITDNLMLIKNRVYYNAKFNKYCCFTKFNPTGNYKDLYSIDFLIVNNKNFYNIINYLSHYDFEYNLAIYELFGINEKNIKEKLNY